MRVAVIGCRGMPGVNGGIERHVEELYPRLVERGVSVTVYARSAYCQGDEACGGVRVVSLGCLSGRYTEAITHTARSMWHARRGGYDLVHVHAIGPGLLLPCARLLGFRRSVLTFHALDYERAKWGPAAKAVLRIAEQVAVRCASEVIAVSTSGARHLEGKYRRRGPLHPQRPRQVDETPARTVARATGSAGRRLRALRRSPHPREVPRRPRGGDDGTARAQGGLRRRLEPHRRSIHEPACGRCDAPEGRGRAAVCLPGYMYGSDSRRAVLLSSRLRAALGGRGVEHQPAGGHGVRTPGGRE